MMISTIARYLHRRINNLSDEEMATTSALDEKKLLAYLIGIPLLLSFTIAFLLLGVASMTPVYWVVALAVLSVLSIAPAIMIEMDHLSRNHKATALKSALRISKRALARSQQALSNDTIRDPVRTSGKN